MDDNIMRGDLGITRPQPRKNEPSSFHAGSILQPHKAVRGSSYTLDQRAQMDVDLIRTPH